MKIILQDILEILQSVDEREWIPVFQYFLGKVESTNLKELNREILKVYGGMGSFNDLVLYKDEQLCFKENVLLDNLRKELFDKIK